MKMTKSAEIRELYNTLINELLLLGFEPLYKTKRMGVLWVKSPRGTAIGFYFGIYAEEGCARIYRLRTDVPNYNQLKISRDPLVRFEFSFLYNEKDEKLRWVLRNLYSVESLPEWIEPYGNAVGDKLRYCWTKAAHEYAEDFK